MRISKQIKNVTKRIVDDLLNVHSLGVPGEQVIYIPTHLFESRMGFDLRPWQKPENWHYPNGIQPGFIFKNFSHRRTYMVRYWQWDPTAGIFLPELRTKVNSEMTPTQCLFYYKFFKDEIVKKAMREIKEHLL